MKLSSILTLLAVSMLLAACSSLDNPFAGWFHGNHDGRVYNPQTGQYEWPAGTATPAPQKSAAVAGALASTPAPQPSGGARVFDPQKNQWVEAHNAGGAASTKPEATPSPAVAPAPVAPVPSAPRPARDTGVYNPSTGKIEWQSAGANVPAPLPPTTAPKKQKVKHWWWPF